MVPRNFQSGVQFIVQLAQDKLFMGKMAYLFITLFVWMGVCLILTVART